MTGRVEGITVFGLLAGYRASIHFTQALTSATTQTGAVSSRDLGHLPFVRAYKVRRVDLTPPKVENLASRFLAALFRRPFLQGPAHGDQPFIALLRGRQFHDLLLLAASRDLHTLLACTGWDGTERAVSLILPGAFL
ncbi:hypothetical protein MTO96_004117 [Rhipicephalus appendiculatus]